MNSDMLQALNAPAKRIIFKGDDFKPWRDQMILQFMASKTYLHLSANKPMEPNQARLPDDHGKYLEWIKENDSVKAQILLHMDHSLRSPFMQIDSARGVWDAIHETFEPSSSSNIIIMCRNLFGAKLNRCDPLSIMRHMEYMRDTVLQINSLSTDDFGIFLPDQVLLGAVYESLPSIFNETCLALQRDQNTTFSQAKQALIEAAKILGPATEATLQSKASDEGRVFMANSRSTSRRPERKRQTQRSRSPPRRDQRDYRSRSPYRKPQREDKPYLKYCSIHGKNTSHSTNECRDVMKDNKTDSRYKGVSMVAEGNDVSNQHDMIANGVCMMAELTINDESSPKLWYLDSGASHHMTGNESLLLEAIPDDSVIIRTASGRNLRSESKGTIWIGDENFHGVIYVPSLKYNLLSVSKLVEQGYTIKFDEDKCRITYGTLEIIDGVKHNNLWALNKLNSNYYGNGKAMINVNLKDSALIHSRFGHVSDRKITRSLGLSPKSVQNCDCLTCAQGKARKSSFPKRRENPPNAILKEMHSDIYGPIRCPTYQGGRYFVIFVDYYSRFKWTYILIAKSDIYEAFKLCLNEAQFVTGEKLKCLHSDDAPEYSDKFHRKFLMDNGIHQRTTAANSQSQNGLSERSIGSIVNIARCLLIDSNLPPIFWGDAIKHATLISNIVINDTNDRIPWNEIYKRPFDYKKDLKVFGCIVEVKNEDKQLSKLAPKTRRGLFLGVKYTGAYHCYIFETKRRITSTSVLFFENLRITQEESQRISNWDLDIKDIFPEDLPEDKSYIDLQEQNFSNQLKSKGLELSSPGQLIIEQSPVITNCQLETAKTQARKSMRMTKPPERLTGNSLITYQVPDSLKEALNSEESVEWRAAIEREIHKLELNQTWIVCRKLPENTKVLPTKWVFDFKKDHNNEIIAYKARLVVRGDLQIDFKDTFSPTLNDKSFRMLICIATEHHLDIHHMDFDTAFLNGMIEDDVYIKLPAGIEGNHHYPLKLKKALYGLKQSAKIWFQTINEYLLKIGFTCISDNIYSRNQVLIGLYVDDLLILFNDPQKLKQFKTEIMAKFAMKDLGEITKFNGYQVYKTIEGYYLSQEAYINQMLKDFDMMDVKIQATPICATNTLTEGNELDDNQTYQRATCSINYLSTKTRPEITYTVNTLLRFNAKPKACHWKALKHLFGYLKGTTKVGLNYKRSKISTNLSAYSDADWATKDHEGKRNSTSGCLVIHTGIISWKSKRQEVIATSSTHSEIIAASEVAKEIIYLRNLYYNILDSLGSTKLIREPTKLLIDNTATIATIKSHQFTDKSKHIEVRHQYVREQVSLKKITVQHVSSSDQRADMLTKALDKQVFNNQTLLNDIIPKEA